MNGIEGKLNKLADKMAGGREDHLAEVAAMRKTFKDATLKKSLKTQPAFQKLLATLKKREQAYSTLLSNKPTDEKRVEWFARREEDRFILSFFEVDKTLESLEAQLDYQLSDSVEEGSEE